MFVRSIVADAFATNCYIVAPATGEVVGNGETLSPPRFAPRR